MQGNRDGGAKTFPTFRASTKCREIGKAGRRLSLRLELTLNFFYCIGKMKWLCKLLVSNAAGRKMWMWRIACHAKLQNSWTKNQVLNVFCETKFSITPNDFWTVWTVHLLAYVSCRLLVLYCFQVRRLWSGTWMIIKNGWLANDLWQIWSKG